MNLQQGSDFGSVQGLLIEPQPYLTILVTTNSLRKLNCFKIVRVFASTNQKHYSDLGSNTLATSFHVETTGGVVVSRNVGCFLKLAKC